MKIDLVMWSKHGAKPGVLDRIDRVIPKENMSQKLIVVDLLSDVSNDFQKLAESHNWQLIINRGHGISGAANTALKNVKTEIFASFEDDVLLGHDWWIKLQSSIGLPDVGAVSGVRFPNQPNLCHMQEYVYKKYIGEGKLPAWLRSRQMSSFLLGKTLDNTLWNTGLLRSIGGFPEMQANTGLETILAYSFSSKGYKWIVDYEVKSVHLRNQGIRQELSHQYWYASGLKEISKYLVSFGLPPPVSDMSAMFRFIVSPASGLLVAVKTRDPQIVWIHPLLRFYYMKGLLESKFS
jgi:hypothetical protein